MRSHSEYREGSNLIGMIEEDLVAERIAIQSYSEITRWLGEDDSVTRRLIEKIMRIHEEHADALTNMLAKVACEITRHHRNSGHFSGTP